MNLADTLRGLLRRWYITFPGLAVAFAVALGAWYAVPPTYERSATQLLLPGKQNMPVDSNPFLFLGGLSSAADVVVRAVGAKNVLDEVLETHPGTTVNVARDGSSAAPFIVITVTSRSDSEAGQVLSQLLGRTGTVLASLQKSQRIPADGRITVETVSVDTKGTLQQRNRLVATVAAGVVVAALALLLAAMTDGLMRQRRRRTKRSGLDHGADERDPEAVDDEAVAPRAEVSQPATDTLAASATTSGEEEFGGVAEHDDDSAEERNPKGSSRISR